MTLGAGPVGNMMPGGMTPGAVASVTATLRLERHGLPLTGHIGSVLAMAAAPLPDGRALLATGSDDRTVRLWNPDTGVPIGQPLTGHTDSVHAVPAVPLPDGRALLASGGDDGTVRLWDPDTEPLPT